MKVAIIGANGQLGSDFCDQLTAVDLVPLTHADIEISDFDSAKQVLLKHRPDVVINTAAYLKADDCEVNPDTAFRVNALGAQNVAIVCDNISSFLSGDAFTWQWLHLKLHLYPILHCRVVIDSATKG